MAVNYRTSLKTTRMTAVRDDIDSGSGAGYLEIYTSGFATLLATIVLNDPCGSVSGDTLTFSGFPKTDSAADNSGTAAVARIKESGGTTVVNNLTVGTSGADINLNSVAVDAGEEVTITSASIQHAA